MIEDQETEFFNDFEFEEENETWLKRNDNIIPKAFKQAQDIEEQILRLNNLEIGRDIEIKNVKVSFNGVDEDWIHTYISIDKGKEKKRRDKQPLVLIHGYGGGSILFQKMFKKLSQKFKVYCIDIIGLNLSSRPKVDHLKTVEEIIDFFVESIQKWVSEIGLQDTPFYLAGHSFGGYIASFYCKNYQDQVKKLILFSPAGISKISKQENDHYQKSRYPSMKMKDKIVHWIRSYVWKYKITYEWLYSFKILPKKYIMKKMICTRLKTRSQKELNLWSDFYNKVLQLPISTSRFVYSLFFFPRVIAHNSVEEIFSTDMKVPVQFFYGSNDWMNKEGAQRLQSLNKDLFNIDIIQKSGHHVIIDNPEDLSDLIITKLLQTEEKHKLDKH